ncbi:MAG: adaptor protein MecA [Lachnospiraceae bacterium]|nr:adaptor protein MecA [Lachnospiraceae bacterium]
MKIEKINENQIRCTLTREDLQQHQIKLSELAYGSEKAQRLFHQMMNEAQRQFGFDAENAPLMIEAIPNKTDSLVLVITRVDDPEELDTRFAKFTPSENTPEVASAADAIGENILDIFQQITEEAEKASKEGTEKAPGKKQASQPAQTAKSTVSSPEPVQKSLVRIYAFPDIDAVIAASHGIGSAYHGSNTLYRSANDYKLILNQSSHAIDEFNRYCNILSEYGSLIKYTPQGAAHIKEHDQTVLKGNALQKLASL